MARFSEQYDAALLGILQNEGNISAFLDTIFGFLCRKTDFYYILNNKDDKMGFPPGVAHKIVEEAYRKFEGAASKRRKTVEDHDCAPNKQQPKLDNKKTDSGKKVQAASETGDQATGAGDSSTEMFAGTAACAAPPPAVSTSQAQPPVASDEQPSDVHTDQGARLDKPEQKAKDEDDNSELTPEQKAFQANPETYNGADRGAYKWSQNITELDVNVCVPETIRKGSMVQVQVKKKHLLVSVLGADKQWETVVDQDLTWEVKADSFWSLTPGKHVFISLEKVEERWWDSLFVDEAKINTRKIDVSRPITDLDDEAQAKIEEMMYNENQKRLGKPQSHETKMHKLLQEAWNAPGSPFAGQSFDPSLVSVNSSGVVTMKPPEELKPPGGSD